MAEPIITDVRDKGATDDVYLIEREQRLKALCLVRASLLLTKRSFSRSTGARRARGGSGGIEREREERIQRVKGI